MDIVTDLTSQTISFLTLLQDISKDRGLLSKRAEQSEYMPAVRNEISLFRQNVSAQAANFYPSSQSVYSLDEKRLNRVKEILFCTLDPDDADQAMVQMFFEICGNLLVWLDALQQKHTSFFYLLNMEAHLCF